MKRLVMLAMALCGFNAIAEEYNLPAGQTGSISTASIYGTMTVGGDLTVEGGAVVTVDNINMPGGILRVKDADTKIGAGGAKDEHKTTVHLSGDGEGGYGKIVIDGASSASGKSFCAFELYLDKEDAGMPFNDGYIDFASINDGAFNVRHVYNNSSLTGRLTVAGSVVAIHRPEPRTSNPIFGAGAFRIELKDGVTLLVDVAAQGGYFNAPGTRVDLTGEGTLLLGGTYSSTSHPMSFNAGAHLNHNGAIEIHKANSRLGSLFQFADDDVIGPNVTGIGTFDDCVDGVETLIQISSGVTLTLCGDVNFTREGDRLTGGTLRIDATDDVRSFKAKIAADDTFVLEKVGANDLVVSATPVLPHLVVNAGAVRFTENCEVGEIVGLVADDQKPRIVADGCEVTLLMQSVDTVVLETANGGSFKTMGDLRIYGDEASVFGALHCSGGTLSFSKLGLAQRYWRLTMRKTKNQPAASSLNRFYGFGLDGSCVTLGIASNDPQIWTNGVDQSVVASGKARWMVDETQSIEYSDGKSWHRNLGKVFDNTSNNDHGSPLSNPLIDENDVTTHLAVEFCVAAGKSPMMGYTILTIPKGTGDYLTSWDLAASYDGLNWTIVDQRRDVVKPGNAALTTDFAGRDYNTYYKGQTLTRKEFEYFTFANYQTPGVEPSAMPMAVQADNGGTIDLGAFATPQMINRINIDMSQAAGTVTKGKLATTGAIYVTSEEPVRTGTVLPLVLDDVADAANVENWSVFLNGKAVRKTVKYDAATGLLTVCGPGLLLLFR